MMKGGERDSLFCIAIAKPSRTVVCLDGDGAMGMHMGNAMAVGLRKPSNYLHVLINNGVHDSVGAQPTGAYDLDYEKIALGLGYGHYARAEDADGITFMQSAWTMITFASHCLHWASESLAFTGE